MPYFCLAQNFGEFLPTKNTLGYWKFNGNSTDYSGNGNSGRDIDVIYNFSSGRFGQGVECNNIDSILIPAADFLFQKTDEFTISIWINPWTSSNGISPIKLIDTVNGATTGIQVFHQIDVDHSPAMNLLDFIITDGKGQANGVRAEFVKFVSRGWYNVICTNDGTGSSGMKIYIDGNDSGASVIYNNLKDPITYYYPAMLLFDTGSTATDCYHDEFIIETGCWDQKKISNYYNYTNAKFSRNN